MDIDDQQDEIDPRPQAPVRPTSADCCNSGCNPCVFELYEEEMQRYERALAQWQARHAGR